MAHETATKIKHSNAYNIVIVVIAILTLVISVTITADGYRKFNLVTVWGNATAMFTMIIGAGVIGVLASLLSNLLQSGLPPASPEQETTDSAATPRIEFKIDAMIKELAAIRQLLEKCPRR